MSEPNDPSIEPNEEPTGNLSPLASFVGEHEAELLGSWVLALSGRSAMQDVPRSTLAARASLLLASLARAPTDLSMLDSVGRKLALTQLAEGVAVAELMAHYSILRDILIAQWSTTAEPTNSWLGVGAINRAVDTVVNATVAAATELRARSLSTIQSLSLAVLENVTLDELLQCLLTAFHELAPAVEAAAFYLTEEGLLRLRASFGISDQDAHATTINVGEGFVGRIASEKRPLFDRAPSVEPMTPAPWAKMRAAQGLPLMVRGQLVGVAVMGSYSSWDFARTDQVAFEVVAKQASTNIHDWKVRESIETQKARLDAVLTQIPVGLILAEAPSGNMILHSPQVEAIWRRPFIASASVEAYRAWPAYRRDGRRLEAEEFPLARAIAGQVVINDEVEILRGDGTWGTILSNAAPIRARDGRIVGGVTTFVDITEKRATERRLQEMTAQAQGAEAVHRIVAEAGIQLAEAFQSGTTLQSIVSVAVPRIADGCAVFLARDGQPQQLLEVAHVEPRKAALVRAAVDRHTLARVGEIAVRVCRTQKPEILPTVTEEFLRELSDSGDDLAILRELGLMSVMVLPLVARGNALGAIAFAATNSRKEFSREDVDLAQELTTRIALALDNERLYLEAQHAVRLREEVLEVISHDLRNPLGAVRLSAERLARPGATEKSTRRRAELILSGTARMERLIHDLLDFAAMRSGHLSIERKPTDVAQIVPEVCMGFEDAERRTGVALVPEVEPGLPHLNIDRERILQVLENLISNALKVTGARDTVTVRVLRKDSEIIFTVADTGAGIPAEDLPHLFDRYFRGRAAHGLGLGLGLPIARAIVEGHGGHIWVESALGKGSTFSVSIPLDAPVTG